MTMRATQTVSYSKFLDVLADLVPSSRVLKLPISILLALALSTSLAIAQSSSGPIIFTVAGGTLGDGKLATSTGIGEDADTFAVDKSGNIYVSDGDNYVIHKVDATIGILSTFAGNGRSPRFRGFLTDDKDAICPALRNGGQATSAQLCEPRDVTVDTNGNVYFQDEIRPLQEYPSRIRKVDPSGGITTLSSSFSVIESSFVVDSAGNIYFFSDGNSGSGCYVLKLSEDGVMTIVAGNGTCGFSGDGGLATKAEISPTGVGLDGAGNIYINDHDYSVPACHVRRVDKNGVISTVAGNGTCGFSGDGGLATNAEISPYGIAVDEAGNFYLNDDDYSGQVSACRVRKVDKSGLISTVAGNGTCGFTGDGGPATSAEIGPSNIAVDGGGNFYMQEFGPFGPGAVIRKVNGNGIITTVAGNGSIGYSGDGGAKRAEIDGPAGLAVDSNNLYVADYNNFRIRKIDRSGKISTVAGNGENGGSTGDGGPATDASIFIPAAVAFDNSHNLLLSETEYFEDDGTVLDGVVRKVDGSGIISTVSPATCGNNSRCYPLGLAIDVNGNIYFSSPNDYRVYKFAIGGSAIPVAGDGTRGTNGDGGSATSAQLYSPGGLAFDIAGNLYIGDRTRVRKVDTSGTITTYAGNGTFGDSGDGGPATSAKLSSVSGLAVDSTGNLYIADGAANRIRKVDAQGVITAFAGNGMYGYSGDGGPAINAKFYNPGALAISSHGDLFVGDVFNYRVREIALPSTMSANPKSISIVSAGSGANAQLSLTAAMFFTGSATLACKITFTGSGAAADIPACALSKDTVSFTDSSTENVTLKVSTTAPQAGIAPLGVNPHNPGTTAGNYNVTVTATSGSFWTSIVVPTVVR